MNNILELRARFEQKGNVGGGGRDLPSNSKVDVNHLIDLCGDLERLANYWKEDTFLNGALVFVYYDRVIAKSNRLKVLLAGKGKVTPNLSIVGAKFLKTEKIKHIITHYVSDEILQNSINLLKVTIKIVNEIFNGFIDNDKITKIKKGQISFSNLPISKTKFIDVIVDSFYVEKFDVEDNPAKKIDEPTLITLYKTEFTIKSLMAKLGINDYFHIGKSVDETTLLLNPLQYERLRSQAPYLIAMSVTDFRYIQFEHTEKNVHEEYTIPLPKSEPTIGVIDSLFDEDVYFSDWVDYTDLVSNEIKKSARDKDHGTMVSSIIVDGPQLNPDLDDGCGRFQVRHFGVVAGGSYSSFSVIRSIKDIVEKNQDIKVWNLCLGSSMEIEENFISPEAAVLDELQNKYDITFVIAGTNKTPADQIKIGAPADSINSLVVNSVNRKNEVASYTRVGPVLSFYTKPDLSYYGGDKGEEIAVYSYDKLYKAGTSFAAPWISRKLAYLIHVIGLQREIAKALLIDSAAGWNNDDSKICSLGYGVVPIKINDILQSKEDEIRFLMTGKKELYDTYNYNIPVPVYKDKHPFIARATLCYYPKCFRNQGVDYAATELQILFGRMDNNGKIKSIDNDFQCEQGVFITEESARKEFRKWDNIKHIGEFFDNKQPRKSYDSKLWGISIKAKERLEESYGKDMSFGIVITLKELNGKNRINDFIQACQMKNILVRPIEIQNQIDIYNKLQADIELE